MKIQFGASRNRKRGFSTVIGAVLILGMMLSVGYSFFYTVSQGEQLYLRAAMERNYAQVESSQENIVVSGLLMGPAFGFMVNNTGIRTTIVAYFVINESNQQIVQYSTGSSSTPSLPYVIAQGQSVSFDTGVLYTYGESFVIKVVTSRGTTATALYPPTQLSVQTINSQVAAGIGSVEINFSSFVYYSYSNPNGPYVVNLAQQYTGAYVPYETPIVFSVQITDNDPNQGSITINSHSDLFVYQQCTTGCGQQPLIVFYIVNIAPNGTITSTSTGSFAPITIEYGTTQTLYFASTTDLSLGTFSPLQVSGKHSYGLGENDVFLVLTGTNTNAGNSMLHAQNIPFAASYVSTDIAFYTESPVSCTHSTSTTFTLTITNSKWSSDSVGAVTIDGTSLSSATGVSSNGSTWTSSGTGLITWSSPNKNKYISPGSSIYFTWKGTTPSAVGTQLVFPITITWDDSPASVQESAVGCFVN